MKRTNIAFDEKLMASAKKISGFTTYREVIELALRFFVQENGRKSLKDLFGKIEFTEDYDYKALRKKR